ncbi:hypothetical protein CRM22_008687 [Opisthorchis felineus]|uniref:CUB domain-containing protein n=1 Tax=Opisthorchis felineus TaxID=147828 RepID=A0A4S2LAR0_OPIFE|nr:hypothetical protein CRM22_008687 [Opisthorchis felineus]
MNFATVCCILLVSRRTAGNEFITLAVRTAPEGKISSPGFPDQYPSDLDTAWRIERPNGQRIRLQFLKFSLEWDDQCAFDRVMVYDGYNSSAKKIGSYCGSGLPDELFSTDRFLYIRMLTDDSVSCPGFLAEYKCYKDTRFSDTSTQSVVTTDTETTSTTPTAEPRMVRQVTEDTSTTETGPRSIIVHNPDLPATAPKKVPAVPRVNTPSTKYPLFRYGWIGRSPIRSPARRRGRLPIRLLRIRSVGLGYLLTGTSGTISPQWFPVFLSLSTLLR